MNDSLLLAAETVSRVLEAGGPSDDAAFDALVTQIHDAQCEAIPPLGQLALHRGRGPGFVQHWADLPAVPTAAYKRYELYAGPPPVRTFVSSGTSGAQVSRAHYSATGMALMDQVISLNARRMLFPDSRPTRILVLAPPPSLAPGMIMASGMERLMLEFGTPGSRFLLKPGQFDLKVIMLELETAASQGVPVTLIGASFGFVHLLDAMARDNIRIPLVPGSRTMDAGGFKGRSREVTAGEMRDAIQARLGIDADWCINLLGMTELPSQLYDDRLAARFESRPPLTGKRIPPWMRTTVLDPATLRPCAPGQPGLLQHVDLANVERPLALLTDDMGVMEPDGSFQILGRAAGAEARGCSLSLEEWTRAQQGTAGEGAV